MTMTLKKLKIQTIITAMLIAALVIPTSAIPNTAAEQPVMPVTFDTSDLKPSQVMTPFGPWDADKVKEWDGVTPIPADEIIGKWKKEHPSEESPAQKIIKERAKATRSDNRGGNIPHVTDGWNMYNYWNSGTNLSRFTGNWQVPTSPTSYGSGDVIFTFIGLQTASDDQIIQPVLQYGSSAACNVTAWRIASWWVGGDFAFYSTCKNASSSNTIYGEMVNTSGQTWAITTKNVSTGTQTTLQVNTGQNWPHAYVALETYHLSSLCSNLSGDIPYTNLKINNGALTPSWTEIYGYTWCGMDINTISASSVSLNNNN